MASSPLTLPLETAEGVQPRPLSLKSEALFFVQLSVLLPRFFVACFHGGIPSIIPVHNTGWSIIRARSFDPLVRVRLQPPRHHSAPPLRRSPQGSRLFAIGRHTPHG